MMSIKDIVFKRLKDYDIGEGFTLGTLVRALEDNGRFCSDETILRRLRELRSDDKRINYRALGGCKFRLDWIDNGRLF